MVGLTRQRSGDNFYGVQSFILQALWNEALVFLACSKGHCMVKWYQS